MFLHDLVCWQQLVLERAWSQTLVPQSHHRPCFQGLPVSGGALKLIVANETGLFPERGKNSIITTYYRAPRVSGNQKSWFSRAALARYHRLGGLKTTEIYLLGRLKVQDQDVCKGGFFLGPILLCLQMAIFFQASRWPSLCACLCPFPLLKTLVGLDLGPPR